MPISQSVKSNDDSVFEPSAQDPEIMSLEEWKRVTTGVVDNNGNMASQEELEKYSEYKVKYYYYLKDGATDEENNRIMTSANNSAMELKSTVAKWYYTLRNLAVVSLIIVLLYIGIRILLASVAAEKAKYKQMIKDWIVAICLIFVMQYIMVFANNFVDTIIGLFSNVAGQNLHMVAVEKPDEELVNGLQKIGLSNYVDNNGDLRITTNLMGKVRMLAQEQSGTVLYIGYAMCFLILVFYTVYFCIVYAKRLLWTMFLTIIAPLVAVSYPLDKIGDGKSQAFDLWLKEYIFNLVIQPFHLLIYVVFVSSAFDLAGNNVVYSLIALGFMLPAEKFLRKMFGFDKTITAGFMGSVAGAALAMKGLSTLGNFGKGKPAKDKSASGSDKVKFADNKALEDREANSGYDSDKLLGEVANTQGQPNATNSNSRSLADDNFDAYNDTYEAMFGTNEGVPNESQPQIRMAGVNNRTLTGFKKVGLKLTDGDVWREGGKALRSAAKIGGAIVGAGIGASIGVATGDPANVSKYGAAGGYAFSAGAGGIGSRIGEAAASDFKTISDSATKVALGEDKAEEMKKKIADERFKNNKELRRKYAEKLKIANSDKATIDRAMDAAIKFRKYGITDNDLIIKAMKVDGGNHNNWDNAERIAAAQFASKSKDQKGYDTTIEKLRDRVGTEKANSIGTKIRGINKKDNIL